MTVHHGDCLEVMRYLSDEHVDLIYLDPPFNSGKDWGAFNDKWDTDEDYHRFMRERLFEMKRLLKPTGSIYLHCDTSASHYLKIEMDWIFGRKQFRREIIWQETVLSGFKTTANNWIRGHDTILYYVKGKSFTFNKPSIPHDQKYLDMFDKVDEDGRYYVDIRNRRYLDEVVAKGKCVGDVWSDIASMQHGGPRPKERTGYPTQKPVALLERIVSASSNPGDLVLDPFCGSGTTLVAAQRLGREWIGIDASEEAVEIARGRL